MDKPALTGIKDDKPLPLWRLGAALMLLLGVAACYGFLTFTKPQAISWMGGFVFVHWLAPGFMALAGGVWAIRRSRKPDSRRGAFLGILALALLQLLGIGGWALARSEQRRMDGFFNSHIEYVRLSRRPQDWPDPAHPQVYEVGAGLRLAISTVVWTDGLHRSLPETKAPELEPCPETGDPRPLSDLGLQNLQVLVKVCALIHFFHPTDAAQEVNWGRLISQGVRQVEDASTPGDLAQRLQSLLRPYAPQAKLLLPGEPVPVFEMPKGAVLLSRWCHLGVGIACLGMDFTGPTKDRSMRLAGVGLAWGTLRHFYPYWDVTPVNWDSVLPLALREAALAPNDGEYFEAIQHLLSRVKDGHAWANQLGDLSRSSPEVELEMIDGHPIVAARWGDAMDLPLGSEVLTVEGQPVDTLITKFRSKTSAATDGFRDQCVAGWLLLAPPDTSLRVEVCDLKGQRSIHQLITKRVRQPRSLPEPIYEIKPGIFLVDPKRADEDAFNTALPKLLKAKGLVFDLRGYPTHQEFLQHFSTSTLEGMQMWMPETRLPNGLGRTFIQTRWEVPSLKSLYQGRVVFLAGPRVISFGETCLEVVAANHLAPIVGSTTSGTNGNTLHFWVPGNIQCDFTGSKVLKADGSQHHGIGIPPTHPVKHTREALAAGRDEDVERALALIESGR